MVGEEGFRPPATVVVDALGVFDIVVVVVVGRAIDSIQTEEPASNLDPGRGL